MKRKKLLVLVFLTFLMSNSYAQTWEYYKDFPVNINPVDVDINNIGTIFMLTSDYRIFYKMQNQNWVEMPEYGVPNYLCIKVKKSSNRLYIGDLDQGLIATSNFGQTYEPLYLTTDPNSGFHEAIVALSNPNSSGVFFGASFDIFTPTIIKYTNNGTVGQIIHFDPTENPNNIIDEMLFTSDNVLLMGTDNGGIWLSNDNGVTFQHSNFNQHNVFSFTEDLNGTVYALGFNYAENKSFLISSTDYINWTELELPNPDIKYKTVFFENGNNNLWLASGDNLYKTNVSGDSISSWNNANYNNGSHSCIELLKYSDNVYNFSNEYVMQTNSNGETWSSPLTQGLNGISIYAGFGDNNKLFTASYSSTILSSLDNSNSNWINKSLSNYFPGDCIAKPDGRIYIPEYKKVFKSIDNGVTFTEITPPNVGNSYVSKFYVGENHSLFAVINNDSEKLYRSTDDGNTWQLFGDFTSTDPFDPATIQSISEDSSGRVFVTVLSSFIFFDFNFIYYTEDNGANWNYLTYDSQAHQEGCSSSYNSVKSVGNTTFCAPCGKTYKIDLNNSSDPFVEEITFNGNSIAPESLKVNGNGDYYIFYNSLQKSNDGGQTWVDLGIPDVITNASAQVNDIFFDNDYNVFLTTRSDIYTPQAIRGFYKLTENLNTVPHIKTNIDIVPNPATNYINISHDVELKDIKLIDVTGKIILTSTEDNINISSLSKGVYMIRVEDINGNFDTKKLIKN